MKPNTLRRFQTLHTWVGLMAGWALFIAFFAGAITVFHHELHAWQAPERTAARLAPPAVSGPEVDRFMQKLVAEWPDAAASTYLSFPEPGEPGFTAFWMDKAGTWHHTNSEKLESTVPAKHLDTSLERSRSDLASFLDALHYSLGLDTPGMYFMGVISVLYGLALVSGVLLHLPRLTKDLFAVRPGRNLKRFWMDAHNVIGLFSLPFHLIFAITGALFCLSMVLLMALDTLTFDGKLMGAVPRITAASPEVQAAGRAVPTLPTTQLLAIARAESGQGFAPASIRFQHFGDANAIAEIRGDSVRALGNYGSIGIHAASGEPRAGAVISNQTAAGRDTNHGLYSALYALHFGTFGDLGVRLVYLIAGLAGAFLFYSGNILWIESRRKTRQAEQPRVHRLLAQATVGVCIGSCIGIALCFPAALLWPERATALTYYPVWGVAIVWALLRPPVRAAVELLVMAALAALSIPVSNAVLTGDHVLRAAASGHWAVAGFDIGAIALAVGFLALAHATLRRAHQGPAHSVWAIPGTPSAPPTAASTARSALPDVDAS